MKPGTKNSYNSLSDLKIDNKNYKIFSLTKAEENGLHGISKLPKSLKVLLENLLRYEDDLSVNKIQIEASPLLCVASRPTLPDAPPPVLPSLLAQPLTVPAF